MENKVNPKIYSIYCRFLFLILIPAFVLYVIFSTMTLLPYWVFTGNNFYDTKICQSFSDWYIGLSEFKNNKNQSK